VQPETVELNMVLKELNITYEQLIDVGILVGTDFNPEGVKGVGPKTALKLIQQHGTIENVMPTLRDVQVPVEPQRIREIFLRPKVTDNYKLAWKAPDVDGAVDFLCREKDFSEERVRKALTKMIEGMKEIKGKVTLETWFERST
jgi:flap endonuclease-1